MPYMCDLCEKAPAIKYIEIIEEIDLDALHRLVGDLADGHPGGISHETYYVCAKCATKYSQGRFE